MYLYNKSAFIGPLLLYILLLRHFYNNMAFCCSIQSILSKYYAQSYQTYVFRSYLNKQSCTINNNINKYINEYSPYLQYCMILYCVHVTINIFYGYISKKEISIHSSLYYIIIVYKNMTI